MKNLHESQALFPETNCKVAGNLFVLEVGLRELIIETLSDVDGAQWYTTLLPPDVAQKYLRGRQAEKAAKWTTHVEHHPLYYVDFPDLAKVLEKNWKATFQSLFSDKGVFLGNLKSLEPIRNKLAHNRKASLQDCAIVSGVLTTFESAIGKERLSGLVHKCSVAPSILEVMGQLVDEVAVSRDSMASLSPVVPLRRWPGVRDSWWFNGTFLTATNHASRLEVAESKLAELKKAVADAEKDVQNLRASAAHVASQSPIQDVLDPVIVFFDIYEDFTRQPRARGTGHKLEAWRDKNDIAGSANAALNALETVKAGVSNE
ncbi:MAG: Swt1 family HEPN domain-containing protein [Planctomycetales bacterium]|nr:Swt1 family HEPN domain-containing protein [Planctomycetales bacterium]